MNKRAYPLLKVKNIFTINKQVYVKLFKVTKIVGFFIFHLLEIVSKKQYIDKQLSLTIYTRVFKVMKKENTFKSILRNILLRLVLKGFKIFKKFKLLKQ